MKKKLSRVMVTPKSKVFSFVHDNEKSKKIVVQIVFRDTESTANRFHIKQENLS